MRILALDFGDRRIGAAVSDPLGITARSLGAIERSSLNEDLKQLKGFISEYGVEEIVVGYPLNMDGSTGKRVEKTDDFINFLKKRVEIPVISYDERLTTMQAERILLEADLSRARRKKVIDGLAAQIILQNYLDARKNCN